MDVNNIQTITTEYNFNSLQGVKIPLKEISRIKGKRQPVAFILGTLTTLSYIGFITSPFIARQEENYQFGLTLLRISAPVLITAWPLYYILGKKKYHFDSRRSNKKIWSFVPVTGQ
jgi:hypothetical protein